MAKKRKDNINKHSGATSTKEINGVRKNGILYIKKGVGTGCFSRVNASSSSSDVSFGAGSSHILPDVKK